MVILFDSLTACCVACCMVSIHIPIHLTLRQVVCRTKRMGGSFGGKETRSMFLSCVAALAAHVTGRPVRLCVDRDVDMQITGHRHAFLARYTAGATK